MKVVWASTVWPWPLDSGGRIRAFQTVQALAPLVDDLAIVGTADPGVSGDALRAAIPGVRVLDPIPLTNRIRRDPTALARTAMVALRTGQPYRTAKFDSAEFARTLARALDGADLLYLHYVGTVGVLDRLRAMRVTLPPIVVDSHQVEHMLAREMAAAMRGPARVVAPLVHVEARRLRALEQRLIRDAAAIIAITPADEASYRALGASTVATVPPGGWPVVARNGLGSHVLVLGNLHWPPTEIALRAMIPALARVAAHVTVRVAGAGASAGLARRLAAARLDYRGYVPDLEDEWSAARVVVIPGAGTGARMRFQEAFRRGVPVVATNEAAAGLPTDGGALLVAEPDDIAEAIDRVLRDDELACALSVGGHALARDRYSLAVLTDAMRAALTPVFDRARSR